MARNKYPELTITQILDVSLKLFLERGFEQVRMQDIVDRLGGLTKGAVYYHFKNKEDIFDALIEQLYQDFNPYEKVKNDASLTGCEKIRKVITLSFKDKRSKEILLMSNHLLKEPRFLAKQMEDNINIIAPYIQSFIETGNKDGSLSVECPKQVAESFAFHVNIWLNPVIFTDTDEEFLKKVFLFKKIFEGIGLPVIDKEFINNIVMLKQYIAQ